MAERKNIIAFWLAVASSVLLFISGTTGVSVLLKFEDIVSRYADYEWLSLIFVLLLIIASFGGISVLAGGILILKGKKIIGSVFIALGSGAGIITFLINTFISIITWDLSMFSYLSFSSLGVILAVSAQAVSKKKKKRKISR